MSAQCGEIHVARLTGGTERFTGRGLQVCWDWHPESPCRRCISQLLHVEYICWVGTSLLLMLVYRSDDKLKNAILNVACCFEFPCKLRLERMQNLIVTLPVRLSRGLLPFLSSMKFLLPRKTGLQFCLTDWDGMLYSWLSKSLCSMEFLIGDYSQCGESMVHTI